MEMYKISSGDEFIEVETHRILDLEGIRDGSRLIQMCRSCGRSSITTFFPYHPLPGVTLNAIEAECRRLEIKFERGKGP